MSFSWFIKRFVGGIVLCVVAVWCFNEVRMPFAGNVPWSTGNTIWVIVLAIVGILALIWAFNLFISTIRMTFGSRRPILRGGSFQGSNSGTYESEPEEQGGFWHEDGSWTRH